MRSHTRELLTAKRLAIVIGLVVIASYFLLATTGSVANAAQSGVASITPIQAVAAAPLQEVNVRLDTTVPGMAGLMMVTGELSADTSLPATVELMVPTGVEILWIGEVLGGPVANNPQVTMERIPVDGEFDTVRAVLTRSRIIQIEYGASGMVASSPESVSAGVTWRVPSSIPMVRMGVVVPAGSTLTTGPAGTRPEVIDSMRSIFFQEFTDTAPGQDVEFRVTYAAGTGAPGAPGQAQGGFSAAVFPIIAIIVVVGVAVVLLVFSASKKRQRLAEQEDD